MKAFSTDKKAIENFQARFREEYPNKETDIASIKATRGFCEELMDTKKCLFVSRPFGKTAVTEAEHERFVSQVQLTVRFLYGRLRRTKEEFDRYVRARYRTASIMNAIHMSLEKVNILQDMELDIHRAEEDGWDRDALLRYDMEEDYSYPYYKSR